MKLIAFITGQGVARQILAHLADHGSATAMAARMGGDIQTYAPSRTPCAAVSRE